MRSTTRSTTSGAGTDVVPQYGHVIAARAAAGGRAAPQRVQVRPGMRAGYRSRRLAEWSKVVSSDAGGPVPLADPIGARWVVFDGPPFVEETPMHGGPPWRLEVPGLPARVRSSGALLIPFSHERGLSTVPNLAVRFLSPDGARVVRTAELLTESEFDHALAGGDAEKRAAFAALGDTVRARVLALDAELDAGGADFVPLDRCTIEPPDPYAGWPPCGAVQMVACGGVTFRYLGGRQTLETPRGRRTFPGWRKRKVHGSDGADATVNECVGAAALDCDAKALVLRMANLCAVPGDWCSVESDWRVVPVGL